MKAVGLAGEAQLACPSIRHVSMIGLHCCRATRESPQNRARKIPFKNNQLKKYFCIATRIFCNKKFQRCFANNRHFILRNMLHPSENRGCCRSIADLLPIYFRSHDSAAMPMAARPPAQAPRRARNGGVSSRRQMFRNMKCWLFAKQRRDFLLQNILVAIRKYFFS